MRDATFATTTLYTEVGLFRPPEIILGILLFTESEDVSWIRGGFDLVRIPSGDLPKECAQCGRTESWIEVPTKHGTEGHGVLGCPYCDE